MAEIVHVNAGELFLPGRLEDNLPKLQSVLVGLTSNFQTNENLESIDPLWVIRFAENAYLIRNGVHRAFYQFVLTSGTGNVPAEVIQSFPDRDIPDSCVTVEQAATKNLNIGHEPEHRSSQSDTIVETKATEDSDESSKKKRHDKRETKVGEAPHSLKASPPEKFKPR